MMRPARAKARSRANLKKATRWVAFFCDYGQCLYLYCMTEKTWLWKLVHTGLLSGGMSALVALIVTIVNTGLDGGLGARWFFAWLLAYPVAWFAALIWGPSARMLTNRLVTRDPKS